MGLNTKNPNNLARAREIAIATIIRTTTKPRSARGDKRNQIIALERNEHKPKDLLNIWYDLPNQDTPNWLNPTQIAIVNDDDPHSTAKFQGRTLDRGYQEIRVHVPYLVFTLADVSRKENEWNITPRDVKHFAPSFVTSAAQQPRGWHLTPKPRTFDGKKFLQTTLPVAAQMLHLHNVATIKVCKSVVAMPALGGHVDGEIWSRRKGCNVAEIVRSSLEKKICRVLFRPKHIGTCKAKKKTKQMLRGKKLVV